jgi:hypothetical protein
MIRKGINMTVTSPLGTELSIFMDHRREWAQSHPGKFVVIRGDTILPEFFDEYEDAFRAGIKQFGADRNFLIKQVWKTEPVYFVA